MKIVKTSPAYALILLLLLVISFTSVHSTEIAVDADKTEKQVKENTITNDNTTTATASATDAKQEESAPPVQAGPFINLFGPKLLSLEMLNETSAKIGEKYTNDALDGKKVVGVYFSADWCGPCRQFTPELVSFYQKMNSRRGRKDQFEIIWISSCRSAQSFGQYFTHMNWLALPPEEATGQRGQKLSKKFKVKGIPHLVLLDEVGNVITYNGRTKIPQDRTGLGFPWRNPIISVYVTIVPKSLRLLIKGKVQEVKNKILGLVGVKQSLPV